MAKTARPKPTVKPAATTPKPRSATKTRARDTGADLPTLPTGTGPRALADIDINEGFIRPMGVGLLVAEVEALDRIALDTDIKRNAIMRAAIRYAIKGFRDGTLGVDDLFSVERKHVQKVTLK